MQDEDRNLEIHRCIDSPPPPRGMMRGQWGTGKGYLTPISTQTKNGLRPSTPIQRYQVSTSKTNLTTSHGPGNLCSSPAGGKYHTHCIKHLPRKLSSSHRARDSLPPPRGTRWLSLEKLTPAPQSPTSRNQRELFKIMRCFVGKKEMGWVAGTSLEAG